MCAACRWGSACTFPHHPELPVRLCDEFDPCDILPEADRRTLSCQEETLPGSALSDQETDGPRGLCADCGNRQTCTFTRLEGGVWQCEEYC
jgi:hypothetical protein